MPTLNIKSVPDALYERLKDSARAHRRSINSEAIVCLEGALQSTSVDADEVLARLDHLEFRQNLTPLTDEMLERARNEGRP